MRELEPPFTIDSEGVSIAVSEHSVDSNRIFRLEFPDKRKPLLITVAELPGGKKWWTSLPQGRQAESEQFGKLIANFIRTKRKG